MLQEAVKGGDMAEVVIYTRQYCGYCTAAKRLLAGKGVQFFELDGTEDSAVRAEMIHRSNGGKTFPQVFINGHHVGGSDELHALERAGKLDSLIADKAGA